MWNVGERSAIESTGLVWAIIQTTLVKRSNAESERCWHWLIDIERDRTSFIHNALYITSAALNRCMYVNARSTTEIIRRNHLFVLKEESIMRPSLVFFYKRFIPHVTRVKMLTILPISLEIRWRVLPFHSSLLWTLETESARIAYFWHSWVRRPSKTIRFLSNLFESTDWSANTK